MPRLVGMGKEAQEQAPGSVTGVWLTVRFFTFLNSSFVLLQKEGVRKQHVSLKTPQEKKNQTKTRNL